MPRPIAVLRELLPDLLVAALVLAILAAAWDGSFGYLAFTDRDLTRALDWRTVLPVSGAETSAGSGARVPGPALPLVLGLPFLFTDDPHGAFLGMALQTAVAVGVVHGGLRGPLGARASAAAALLFGTGGPLLGVTRDLWNPAFLPLPLAVATVALVRWTQDEDVRALPVWAGAVAVGAQFHLGMAAWALVVLPFLLARRPPGARRGWAQAAAVALAAYLPYLVVDAARGGENTRLLGGATGDAADTGWHPARLLEAVATLASPPAHPGQEAPGAWAHLAWGAPLALAGVGALVLLRRQDPEGAGPRRMAVALGLGAVAYLALLSLNASIPDVPPRYVLPAAPSLAILAAAGLRAADRRLGSWVWGVALAVLAPRAAAWTHAWPSGPDGHYTGFVATLEAVRARTGWSLRDLAGRTTWFVEPPGVRSGRALPVEHRLRLEGTAFPGSLPPPCALLVPDARAPQHTTPGQLQRALVGHARVLPPIQVDPLPGTGWTLVLYDYAGALCPTTMAQRYVDTADERSLRPHHRTLGAGQARAVPHDAGSRWVAGLPRAQRTDPDCAHALVGVDLVAAGDGLRAALHSPMLRGPTDNEGWRVACAVEDPGLRFVDRATGATTTHPFTEDVVGYAFVRTPLRRTFPRPPGGPWAVHLVGASIGFEDGEWPEHVADRVPFDILLDPAWGE